MIQNKFYLLSVLVVAVMILSGCAIKDGKNLKQLYDQEKHVNCNFNQKCSGEDAIGCFKDALVNSGCFDKDYIDNHFADFEIRRRTGFGVWIYFDYFLEGQELCHSYCRANVLFIPEENDSDGMGSSLEMYEGPESSFMTISKEQASAMLKNEKQCSDFQENESSPTLLLNVRDEKTTNFPYKNKGLYWMIWTGHGPGNFCGRPCGVDVTTGELYIGEYSCV